jgi:WS/DGAT/MGAT family acyltransferase
VSDSDFDAARHVHAHHLPRPHQTDQLAELAMRIMAERLDPDRPLWELHVISGLTGGRFAVLAKLHHALADGAAAVLIGLSLFDGFTPEATEEPVAPPTGRGAAHIALRWLREPGKLIGDSVAVAAALPKYARQARQTADIASSILRSARALEPSSPLVAPTSGERRLATLRLDMDDIKRIRSTQGGTTNDVLLALLAGALRDWLIERGDRVDGRPPRALIPVNQRGRAGDRRAGGNQLSGYLCDLPIAEPDPMRRLAAVRAAMDANKEGGPQRGPGALPLFADRVPAAVHRVATPLLSRGANLLFDLVATNVPLPSVPLTMDGAELRELYPIIPLAAGQALGVAFCGYRGTVHIGLNANVSALPDVDRLADTFAGGLAELQELCA